MITVPDTKIREIFGLLGATEENLDRLVMIYQTRHVQPLSVDLRIEYFNFLGFEDTWERIVQSIGADDIQSIIDFLAVQSPDTLVYKRCLEKLCHFIFVPDWLETLGEMWHRHTLHTHDPRDTWSTCLEYAHKIDSSGLMAERLITQVFKMKDTTDLIIEIRQEYAAKPRFSSKGTWRPLYLNERLSLMETPGEAMAGWFKDRDAAREEYLRIARLNEFLEFVNQLMNQAASPEDVRNILDCIAHYEAEKDYPLPGTRCRIRRYFLEKLIEPYRNREYV